MFQHSIIQPNKKRSIPINLSRLDWTDILDTKDIEKYRRKIKKQYVKLDNEKHLQYIKIRNMNTTYNSILLLNDGTAVFCKQTFYTPYAESYSLHGNNFSYKAVDSIIASYNFFSRRLQGSFPVYAHEIEGIVEKNDKNYKMLFDIIDTYEFGSSGGAKKYAYFTDNSGKQIRKQIFMINGKKRVQQHKNKFVSLQTYKKYLTFVR